MPQKMGIGPIGVDGIVFRHRPRWTFAAKFPDQEIPEHFVKLNFPPISETDKSAWIPGKTDSQTILITHLDAQLLEPLIKVAAHVYDQFSHVSLSDQEPPAEYVGDAILKMYCANGSPLETWQLLEITPRAINFGYLDHSNSSDAVDVEITWKFKDAKYENSA